MNINKDFYYKLLLKETDLSGADSVIVGVDEVGRGPLAGHVTAAAVVLPDGYVNRAIKDSKKIDEKTREKLFEDLKQDALSYAIVSLCPRVIEIINIRSAARLCMELAVGHLVYSSRIALEKMQVKIDGNMPLRGLLLPDMKNASYEEIPLFLEKISFLPISLNQETIVKGDALVPVISTASILAKVERDRMMYKLDLEYPGYGFREHKGYPTPLHRERIKTLGPTPIHRRTFAGVREFI